ncbi:hypothetical protein AOL_s00215g661 [Orbilia oligospora ATCC 24927]|uniref:Uncharacterized protein n=1 Tax=Arthrobotrys oligospora (strain ATCC 24927 / CBS 115.81 / DSM 1491) TaxID=756982 RepID=G1XUK3_ARTOA|nr:hypothetical protein AOL_s00215g661 [Orbilia oligospora ATCC 24927]EGX43205.1 hypothetical protein AOL_s00215g661 [Orbilia oligospora ATCC 24927]
MQMLYARVDMHMYRRGYTRLRHGQQTCRIRILATACAEGQHYSKVRYVSLYARVIRIDTLICAGFQAKSASSLEVVSTSTIEAHAHTAERIDNESKLLAWIDYN